jgi:hypothetical protein
MDYDSMEHFEPAEQLVKVLKNKNRSKEELFFRVLVAYYFSKVASIMRTEIDLPGRGNIPTNMYSLNLAVSGFGKGKSVNIMEDDILKDFKNTFMESTLPAIAEANLMSLAVARASKKGTDPDIMLQDLKKEYASTGTYLFSFDSGTTAAIKQLRHQLLLANAGSINLEMDEVGANFSNNLEVLNTFIELYDIGKIKPKVTKNTVENKRNENIDGRSPTNMLLFGTPSKLLDGGKAEADFYSMLDMGYARRLIFSYVDKIEKSEDLSAEEIYDMMTDSSTDMFIRSLRTKLNKLAEKVNYGKVLTIDKSVALEIIAYELDCIKRAEALQDHQEMQKAELAHRYFKATKLAGTYAFIDGSAIVTIKHLHAAIKLVEESGKAFSKLLKREKSYVKLAKYVANLDQEVTQVDLVEDLPFYKGSEAQKRDLLNLAIAYGYKNNIIIKKSYIDGIEFIKGESLKKNDLSSMIISYSQKITEDYINDSGAFDELAKVVVQPGINFTVNHWKNGYRHKDNLIPGFNMVVLDIDDGISVEAAKNLLSDYTYIIYTTKRHTDTHNRFRVILPLSHEVKLNAIDFQKFMLNVFDWLPFDIDTATKDVARKWGTHPGDVHINHGDLLNSMNFIPQTKKSDEINGQIQAISSMNSLESWFFRQMSTGSRNNMLLRYAYMLLDTGYDLNSIRNALSVFNKKMPEPLPEQEIHETIMVTITKAIAERETRK